MIVDIVELDFTADDLDSYYGSFPVCIKEPQMPDDTYFIGHDACMSIPKHYHRYKLIEHINGVINEHVILTEEILQSPYIESMKAVVYPISTRVHNGHLVETFRYIKPIGSILSRVNNNSSFANGVKTVHQVILETIYGLYNCDSQLSEVSLFLAEYVKERHVILSYLSTASVTSSMQMMENIQDIHYSLRSILFDANMSDKEAAMYLDQAIDLPAPNISVGFINLSLKCNVAKSEMTVGDFLPMVNLSSLGNYACLLPDRKPNPKNMTASVNMHLASAEHRVNSELEVSLLQVLNQLELCDYTDISMEIPYTDQQVPEITIHYSGSIFNNGYMEHGQRVSIDLDITKLFYLLQQSYGESGYHINKPIIRICRTFAEEVYITFSVGGAYEDHVECYDLTLMALLSPTIIDSQVERFVIANIGA